MKRTSLRRTILAVIVLAVLLAAAVGTTLGTASSGVTAETARGPLVDRPLAVNWHFAAGSKIKLQSQGPMEQAVQRIVATPGAISAGTATRARPSSPS